MAGPGPGHPPEPSPAPWLPAPTRRGAGEERRPRGHARPRIQPPKIISDPLPVPNVPLGFPPYIDAPTRPGASLPVSAIQTCPRAIIALSRVMRLLVIRFAGQAERTYPPGAPLLIDMWRRVYRIATALCWLFEAPPRPPGPPAPRPARPAPTRPRREFDRLTLWRITAEPGWLVGAMGDLLPAAEAFAAFLRGPDSDDLLDADPRFAPLLRRLGFMLGVNPDLLPPSHAPDPPAETLHPGDLRPAPRGFARSLRVNQATYEALEAELRDDPDPFAPDLAENSA